jgi:hypothetical protein
VNCAGIKGLLLFDSISIALAKDRKKFPEKFIFYTYGCVDKALLFCVI